MSFRSPVWFVPHPTNQFVEDVEAIAEANGWYIIDILQDDGTGVTGPALTPNPAYPIAANVNTQIVGTTEVLPTGPAPSGQMPDGFNFSFHIPSATLFSRDADGNYLPLSSSSPGTEVLNTPAAPTGAMPPGVNFSYHIPTQTVFARDASGNYEAVSSSQPLYTGPFNPATAYTANQVAEVAGVLYSANGAIPASATLPSANIGTTGATWRTVGGAGTSGGIIGQAATLAALPAVPADASATNQYIARLTADDGSNLKGLYSNDGSGWVAVNDWDDGAQWQGGYDYKAGEKFWFSTTNTTAQAINGKIEPNTKYFGCYPVDTTSNGTLTNAEMATIELVNPVSDQLYFGELDLTQAFPKDALVHVAGELYLANDAIPANTVFTEGTTGATWKAVSGVSNPEIVFVDDAGSAAIVAAAPPSGAKLLWNRDQNRYTHEVNAAGTGWDAIPVVGAVEPWPESLGDLFISKAEQESGQIVRRFVSTVNGPANVVLETGVDRSEPRGIVISTDGINPLYIYARDIAGNIGNAPVEKVFPFVQKPLANNVAIAAGEDFLVTVPAGGATDSAGATLTAGETYHVVANTDIAAIADITTITAAFFLDVTASIDGGVSIDEAGVLWIWTTATDYQITGVASNSPVETASSGSQTTEIGIGDTLPANANDFWYWRYTGTDVAIGLYSWTTTNPTAGTWRQIG